MKLASKDDSSRTTFPPKQFRKHLGFPDNYLQTVEQKHSRSGIANSFVLMLNQREMVRMFHADRKMKLSNDHVLQQKVFKTNTYEAK